MKTIVILIIAASFSANLYCQTMTIHMKNGNFVEYSVGDIDKITYSNFSVAAAAITVDPNSYTDPRDGKKYKTIQIGTQIWMAENLRATVYNDGSKISFVTNNGIWAGLTAGAYCWYDNDTTNRNTYGALYNWYAVTDRRNICPAGWHVPTDAEWVTMETLLGGGTEAGGKLKETEFMHWQSPNTGATNKSGFTGLPGGYRDKEFNGAFHNLRSAGYFWTSTQGSSTHAWMRDLFLMEIGTDRHTYFKAGGLSVRCIRN
jgi:uncharacterized protein (TIGR02145 family)